jgi:hypothetical protein
MCLMHLKRILTLIEFRHELIKIGAPCSCLVYSLLGNVDE